MTQVVAVRFGDVRGRKLAEAASTVNELLYQANVSVTQAVRSGADMAEIQEKLAAFVEKYAASAAGPTKWQRLAEFLRDTYATITNDLVVVSGRGLMRGSRLLFCLSFYSDGRQQGCGRWRWGRLCWWTTV